MERKRVSFGGLAAGDRIRIEVGPEDTLIVRPEATGKDEEPSRLFGLLQHLAKDEPVSTEEMKQANLEVLGKLGVTLLPFSDVLLEITHLSSSE